MPVAVDTPSTAEYSEIVKSLEALSISKTPEERKTINDSLVDQIKNSKNVNKAIAESGITQSIVSAFENKKNTAAREAMFSMIVALSESFGKALEPYVIPFLGQMIDAFGEKQRSVAKNSEFAVKAILKTIPTHSLPIITPYIVENLSSEKAWQTKMAVLDIVSTLSESAPKQVDKALPQLIPCVSACIWDSKPEVCKKAVDVLGKICACVYNPDLHPFIPDLVNAIKDPKAIPDTVYKLAATTFVTTVEAPALAIMAPILIRGLTERTPAVLRQTCVIIDNMCKLVEAQIHIEQFLPKLLPGLDRLIATGADPELRAVATRARATMIKICGGKTEIKTDATANAKKAKELHNSAIKIIRGICEGIDKEHPIDAATLNYVGHLSIALDQAHEYESGWEDHADYFASFEIPADKVTRICAAVRKNYEHQYLQSMGISTDKQDDEGEELCNCDFSLAYGGMILLNNARMRLTRGQRYGLCGPNGVGKSTLMRAISKGQLDGFPPADVLKTVFVEHNLQASDAEKTVLDFVLQDEAFNGMDPAEIKSTLESVGFDAYKQKQGVGALSGGWKMKLELARAMLMKADILLLDEPTNHLDVANVAWLTNYLTSLKDVTSIIVSHDSKFLDDVCSHIIHYESRKLKTYRGNLSQFVKRVPEARSYYKLATSKFQFKFPDPGFLEGVKSTDKAILKLMKVGFKYPVNDHFTFTDASCQCSLNSRIAVLGPNGAGKSTVIKVLTGETEATEGTVWKHPHLRVAYVAQHAFHHIEEHLDKTPNEYIRWRYENGEDRENASRVTRQLSPEEVKKLETPIQMEGSKEKRRIESIVGRRKMKRGDEYEIKWVGFPWNDNTWYSRDKLEAFGLQKVIQNYDEREAALAGLYHRPLTSVNIQKHLSDIGLDAEFSTHSRIRGLSGGQKVKVVIGAAMWDNPHILILDEPTNYLDRDSLGALAQAIRDFKGGVVMVSHHSEFTDALCSETWRMADGKMTVTRADGIVVEKIETKEQTETTDAYGNTVKVKSTKVLSRKEQKDKERRRKLKIKNGEPLSSDDEDDL